MCGAVGAKASTTCAAYGAVDGEVVVGEELGASTEGGVRREVCCGDVVDDVEALTTGGACIVVVVVVFVVVDGDGDGEEGKGGGERVWSEVDGVKVVHLLEDVDHVGVEGVVGCGGVEGGGIVGEKDDRVEVEDVEVEKTMGIEVEEEAASGIKDGVFVGKRKVLGICFLNKR